MKEQPEKFYLLNEEPECTNVCFWYVPERFRPKNFPQAFTSDWQRELGKVTVHFKGSFLAIPNPQHFNIFIFFFTKYLGNCQDQSSHDDWRNHNDQLSETGRIPQLLSKHHFKPSHPREWHWLHAFWTWQTWPRPLI